MLIGYVRVSRNDQTEALQMDALKAAGCRRIYGDHGVSGVIQKRKGLSAILKTLKAGDTLTVWKVDRLGRTTLQLLNIIEDLRKRGIAFKAISQGIDTNTPLGRMIFGQLAVFAEFERELIRERTIAGMQAAKRRGVKLGRPRKLSPAQIIDARHRLSQQQDTMVQLAQSYGVAPVTLSRAL